MIQAAAAQPKVTFDGVEFYPTVLEKVAALGYALIRGHGFLDGNQRVAHAALKVFLLLNGYELDAPYVRNNSRQRKLMNPRICAHSACMMQVEFHRPVISSLGPGFSRDGPHVNRRDGDTFVEEHLVCQYLP